MLFLPQNQKRLLSTINPVLVLAFVLCLIVLRSVSHFWFGGWVTGWDVLLPFMVYFGQRRSLLEGSLLGLFTSHLYSLCSAAPIGVFATLYLILFVTARLLIHVIYANSWTSITVLIFLLSLFSRVLLTIISASFGHGWPFMASGNFSFSALLVTTLMGVLTYGLLTWLDRFTFKIDRIAIEMAEGTA